MEDSANYRTLNKATVKDKHLIFVVEELLDKFIRTMVFSKMKLNLGYHQITMKENNIHKISFRIHEGYYKVLIMGFELTNAPLNLAKPNEQNL